MSKFLAAAAGALVLAAAAAAAPAQRTAGPVAGSWSATAASLRGNVGSQYSFVCPAGGSLGTVWGTGVYTDDSSVCTAAVHAGVVRADLGGLATIEIRAGLSSYSGSSRNGVTSRDYGSWHGSFVLAGGYAGGGASGVKMGGLGWDAKASAYRGANGQRFAYVCPAGGDAHTVWGTDTYTDDSSVCTAAVHVGAISLAAGGTVTIELRAGLGSYTGSAHNGITSRSYGSWPGAFVVPGHSVGAGTTTTPKPATTTRPAATTPAAAGTVRATWSTHATQYRGQNGRRVRFLCPAGGSPRTVWGTAIYTDDSSVCTAAVHAGLLSLARGGTVTIEIRPGRSSYVGTTRNGVTTRRYGSWRGSFVVVGR